MKGENRDLHYDASLRVASQQKCRSCYSCRDFTWAVLAIIFAANVAITLGQVVVCLADPGCRTVRLQKESGTAANKTANEPVHEVPRVVDEGVVCNLSVPLPPATLTHRWIPSAEWAQTCEDRFRHKLWWEYPHDRNWCWLGLKDECHSHLKLYRSWGTMQGIVAARKNVPGRSESPFHPLEDPELCDRPEVGQTQRWSTLEKRMAREWFDKHVKVFVVNLPSDLERWKMISARLEDLDIPAERLPGVDMREPDALDEAKREGWVPDGFNFTIDQEVAYKHKFHVGSILGTLGCATAHFKAQAHVLDQGSPLAVVLEDDTWPEPDFIERLWALVWGELPCDWEVASLMSRCPYGRCISRHLTRVQPDVNEPAWRCRQGVNWGMQGILYRVHALPKIQKIWKETVFDYYRPHCLDIDVALASISDQVAYYAVPASQKPGFLVETDHKSLRWSINVAGTTQPTTTQRLPA